MDQNDLNELNRQIRLGNDALNGIKLDIQSAQADLDALITAKQKAQDDLDALNQDLDSASTARAGKLSEIADLTTQISRAQALLESTKTANDKAAADGATASTVLQASQAKIISDAQDKVDNLTSQKEQLEKEIAPIEDQVSRLTNQITTLNAQIVSLNTQITDATSNLADLNSKINTTTTSLSTLQVQVDALNAEIDTKKATSTALDTEISGKNATLADINDQITAAQATLDADNARQAEFLAMQAGLVDQKRQLDQRTEYLKAKYGELDEQW